MKILLAVDGSPYTQKMLDYLASQPAFLGTSHQYTAIAVQPLLPARARAALGKQVVDQYYQDEAHKVLDPVCKFLSEHGIHAERVDQVGPVAESIAKVAQEGNYDLLIMGTHGHGSLGKLVMGSVSTQVLASSTVPVLLIR